MLLLKPFSPISLFFHNPPFAREKPVTLVIDHKLELYHEPVLEAQAL
jgi:hypothetical protein